MTANIYLRLLFPSTTSAGVVNSRCIATSQFNERAFSDLSLMFESVNGTPPGPQVERMLSRVIQRKVMSLKVDKPYSFRPSGKSMPTYNVHRLDDNVEEVLRHDSDATIPVFSLAELKIHVADHSLDQQSFRKRPDSFDCGKKLSSAPTRLSGPRIYSRIRAEVQILQGNPSLSLNDVHKK